MNTERSPSERARKRRAPRTTERLAVTRTWYLKLVRMRF